MNRYIIRDAATKRAKRSVLATRLDVVPRGLDEEVILDDSYAFGDAASWQRVPLVDHLSPGDVLDKQFALEIAVLGRIAGALEGLVKFAAANEIATRRVADHLDRRDAAVTRLDSAKAAAFERLTHAYDAELGRETHDAFVSALGDVLEDRDDRRNSAHNRSEFAGR